MRFSRTLDAGLLHELNAGIVALALTVLVDVESLPAALEQRKRDHALVSGSVQKGKCLFSRSYLDHLLDDSDLNVTLNTKDVGEDIKAHLAVVVVVVDDFIEELRGVGDLAMDSSYSAGISNPLVGSLR